MPQFSDRIVVYFSAEDGCWVAHSIRTDQVGTGDSPLKALADGIRAVQIACEEASKDSTLALERQAPPDVRRMLIKALPMPDPLVRIAHAMVGGEWPEDLPVSVEPPHSHRFSVDVPQLAACV